MPGPTWRSLSRRSMAAGTSPNCSMRLPRRKARFGPVVVAVDSGSTDGTLELLRRSGARILTVASGEFNHGGTRNLALKSVETEFAVLTVQDALPASRTWLDALVCPLVQNSSLAGTWARHVRARTRADSPCTTSATGLAHRHQVAR